MRPSRHCAIGWPPSAAYCNAVSEFSCGTEFLTATALPGTPAAAATGIGGTGIADGLASPALGTADSAAAGRAPPPGVVPSNANAGAAAIAAPTITTDAI